LYLSVLFLV